ncbi:pyridoxine 5'-phosphate oxidase C-terminal domain-containing protein [Mesorhizobium australicum]
MLAARIEVWHDRPFRLHGRVAATLKVGGWEQIRLCP